MGDHLSRLLGPSIYLMILDMMLENPCQWMNLREIARRIDKNPGSVSPVLPELVSRGLVEDCKVGKVSVVYKLRTDDARAQALMRLKESLKETS
ncbi:hypothetical protein A3K78_10750 [Candidatus Bathyarchaeota archaeon RBG_13_52_12]|nr:MAG: hypothetical protein A3K78_10750 [Candidatus Bathyarchaeota archaeon RBG_13_52_12]